MNGSDAESVIKHLFPFPKRVVIAGAVPHGLEVIKGCKKAGIAVLAVVDGNPELIGKEVEGHTVLPVEKAKSYDCPVILCTTG